MSRCDDYLLQRRACAASRPANAVSQCTAVSPIRHLRFRVAAAANLSVQLAEAGVCPNGAVVAGVKKNCWLFSHRSWPL
eukprot:6013545-Alexandrium_andersonii.AAC.1